LIQNQEVPRVPSDREPRPASAAQGSDSLIEVADVSACTAVCAAGLLVIDFGLGMGMLRSGEFLVRGDELGAFRGWCRELWHCQ
jgi:hypothetical protein